MNMYKDFFLVSVSSEGQWHDIKGFMPYIAPNYTCFGVDLSTDINFSWLIMMVASKFMLHTNPIRLSFQ